MSVHYFVTRRPNSGLVSTMTLDDLRHQVATGELSPDLYATESDGRSFSQFQHSGIDSTWRTLRELLAEVPRNVPVETAEVKAVLVACPVCERQISSAAEACPQCGHPMRPATAAPAGPKCYSCSAMATTRCQSCGALSCAIHLESIYVSHGRGGAYELRCESCYSSAEMWKIVGVVIFCVVVVVVIFFMANMRAGPFIR